MRVLSVCIVLCNPKKVIKNIWLDQFNDKVASQAKYISLYLSILKKG